MIDIRFNWTEILNRTKQKLCRSKTNYENKFTIYNMYINDCLIFSLLFLFSLFLFVNLLGLEREAMWIYLWLRANLVYTLPISHSSHIYISKIKHRYIYTCVVCIYIPMFNLLAILCIRERRAFASPCNNNNNNNNNETQLGTFQWITNMKNMNNNKLSLCYFFLFFSYFLFDSFEKKDENN